MKRNLPKRRKAINVRVSTELLARTVEQSPDCHTGRPVDQTKHRWLA